MYCLGFAVAEAFSAVASVQSSCLPALEVPTVLAVNPAALAVDLAVQVEGLAAQTEVLVVQTEDLAVQVVDLADQAVCQPVPLKLFLLPPLLVAAFVTFEDVEFAGECVALVQVLDVGLHSKPGISRSSEIKR